MLNTLRKLANLVNFIKKWWFCTTSYRDMSKEPNFIAVVTICSLHFPSALWSWWYNWKKIINPRKLEIISKFKRRKEKNRTSVQQKERKIAEFLSFFSPNYKKRKVIKDDSLKGWWADNDRPSYLDSLFYWKQLKLLH